MGVLASATITLSYVTSVESETRYYLLQISTLQPPTKPTTNPPTGGWSQTEPTYDNTKATSTLYTCVLTKFTDGTFRYSEVSVSSSYEAAKNAYNQAHEANMKLASWCAENDTTLIDGGKIATGTVIADSIAAGAVTANKIEAGAITTNKLGAGAVTAEKIDVTDLFSQNITASGEIKSANYNGSNSAPLQNTTGSILKMDDGTFNFGGGKLVLKKINGKLVLTVDGKIDGKDIYICGSTKDYIDKEDYIEKVNLIETTNVDTGNYETSSVVFKISQTYNDTSDDELNRSASIVFENGRLYLNGVSQVDAEIETLVWDTAEIASHAGTSVISSSTIRISRRMGVCFISGGVTLKKAVNDWTTLLPATMIPTVADNVNRYITVTTWDTSYTRPLRISVTKGGGLSMRYGAAKEFQFSIAYPCING